MVWITSQPVWVLVVGSLGIGILVALVSRLLVLSFLSPAHREEAHAIAGPMTPALAATFALLTALTLANEASTLTSDQTIVSTEAADAAIVAWSSTNPGVDTASVHSALLSYLEATRTYEWHGSAAAYGDDPATVRSIGHLERAVRAQATREVLGTPESNELLTNTDALTTQRRLRLTAAAHSLPNFYVVLVIVTGLAFIVHLGVLGSRGSRRSALVTLNLTVVIALSIALLFGLASPWRGPIGISGHPIDVIIHDLKIGYFHS